MNAIKNFFLDKSKDEKKKLNKQCILLIQQGEFEQLVNLCQNKYFEINYQDGRGLTVLMSAVCYTIDNQEIGKQIIELLLSYGADINQTDNGGRSAFFMACHWNQIDTVKIFLKYKPDLDASTNNKFLVLNPVYTVLLKGNYKMAKFLLDNGASYSRVFEMHNCSNQISLNSEALEFLYKYKIEKQKITERMNFLFIRRQLLLKEQQYQLQQQQQNESQTYNNNKINSQQYFLTQLNHHEINEIMNYI